MLAKRLHATLFPGSRLQMRLWFSVSLFVAVLYGLLAYREGQGSNVVQDDARQHLFWMQRFFDPELFPQDLIADYFQSVAPWGYTNFYRLFAAVGIDPFWLSKLLPLGLGVLATAYGFRVCLQFLPVPFTGFLAALLLNQVFWSHDDLASASPRAFMPLLFLAFLYYLLRHALLPCLATIVLEGLFYPQYVLIFAGLLCLRPWRWRDGIRRDGIHLERTDLQFCLIGLGVAVLVLLPYALLPSAYGPVISLSEAQQLPDFYPEGRGRFFLPNPWLFWLSGNRSGIFPTLKPPIMLLGLLLPLLLRFQQRFRQLLLAQYVSQVWLLNQIVIVALLLFGAAHALLFKLHLPSRYTAYTLRFVLVFATALSLTLLLEAGLSWLQRLPVGFPRRVLVWGLSLCVASVLLLYPFYAVGFPNTGYEKGRATAIYQFLANQPKQTLVASLLKEADNLPTFARRPVWVAPEYAIPYHVGYANQFRQRAKDLLQAQYTLDAAVLHQFIQTSGVDFWLIDQDSFQPEALPKQWIRQYPDQLTLALDSLRRGQPVLQQQSDRCTVLREKNWQLLQVDCLLQVPSSPSKSP